MEFENLIAVLDQRASELTRKTKTDERDILELQKGHAADLEELNLIRKLIEIYRPPIEDHEGIKDKFESQLTDLLNSVGKPMHIKEIYLELQKKEIPIPGKGTVGNVVTRLTRTESIERIGRGTYSIVKNKFSR